MPRVCSLLQSAAVKPHVNQVEGHVYCSQPKVRYTHRPCPVPQQRTLLTPTHYGVRTRMEWQLREFCERMGIIVQARRTPPVRWPMA